MEKKNISSRLYLMYALCLMPLIIYGLFKNGINLYRKDLVDTLGMLKPAILLAMGATGALLGSIFRELKTNKNSKEIFNKCKGNIVEATLLVCILPLKTSPIVTFIVTFLFGLFIPQLKVNKIAIMYLIVEGINVLLHLNSFDNPYLENTLLKYDGIDLFWGLGQGGIFSTNILFIIIGFIILSFNKLYKKEMVISSLITFLTLGTIPFMIMGKYDHIFPYIFGYNILFILVYIGPNLYSSSYTTKGQILSGILIGILTYILSFFTPYTAAILAIIIVSLLKGIIDRIFVIK